ncbi:Retrovirus-related Pol polyprotein from transposon TNT 1-94 [Vitis vinifera]|uniref:Retrovirus-related Pol polyprotein from transposon TNT 1-94 n=1 Tax=Vitis vinifera TaxID=29760 RepID=A0A438D0Y3_VITVI|nr:Retrovirus-related Pol polyprotein from transposon TNT 1-94 [Vitis vinifera]
MQNCSSSVAPVVKGDIFCELQCPKNDLEKKQMDKIPYASTVGSIMYAQVCTRPDIAYVVGMLGRYQSNPSIDHWKAVKKVLCYLQMTTDYMLTYRRTDNLEIIGYSDSNYAGYPLTKGLPPKLFMDYVATWAWWQEATSVKSELLPLALALAIALVFLDIKAWLPFDNGFGLKKSPLLYSTKDTITTMVMARNLKHECRELLDVLMIKSMCSRHFMFFLARGLQCVPERPHQLVLSPQNTTPCMCHKKLFMSLASFLPLKTCGFGISTLGLHPCFQASKHAHDLVLEGHEFLM